LGARRVTATAGRELTIGRGLGVAHDLRRLLWRFRLDISRFDPLSGPTGRRRLLFAAHAIGVVLDVGANTGAWARDLREVVGFKGHIRSFEPTTTAFHQLEKRSAGDDRWQIFNVALGDADGELVINIAGNLDSSSILEMRPAHEAAAPASGYVGSETAAVRTLDGIFDEVCPPGERVYLKIDTQGYEGRVLRGANRSLAKIDFVQLEMPLVPLYVGESTFTELLGLMFAEGFELVGLDPGFTDARTGHVLQVDGIFHRQTSPNPQPQE